MLKQNYSDKEIVASIKSGEADAGLQFLYDTTRLKVLKYILSNNGNKDEAQDIFQDAVVIFYKYVLNGKFDSAKSIDGFIFYVSRNLWINRAKQLNRTVNETSILDNAEEESNFWLVQLSKEREEKIEKLLSNIGERCKELLTYTIFYKLKMDKVAKKMGLNDANSAKTQNYKCKQKLKRAIKSKENFKELLYS